MRWQIFTSPRAKPVLVRLSAIGEDGEVTLHTSRIYGERLELLAVALLFTVSHLNV